MELNLTSPIFCAYLWLHGFPTILITMRKPHFRSSKLQSQTLATRIHYLKLFLIMILFISCGFKIFLKILKCIHRIKVNFISYEHDLLGFSAITSTIMHVQVYMVRYLPTDGRNCWTYGLRRACNTVLSQFRQI